MSLNYSVAEISATEKSSRLLKGYPSRPRLSSRAMENESTADPREVSYYEELSWRLKLAVEEIDRPKGEIAASIGVSQQRLSNWITNQNKPDWFGVSKLCRRYGISADWVLLGDLKGVPYQTADSWERALEDRKAGRLATPGRGT